jgi:anti-sigma B factor antagonist
MTEQITFEITTTDRYAVVAVTGEIDISSAPRMRETIESVVEGGPPQLIVDLGGVEFMDSSGLNTLIAAVRHMGPESLRVVATHPHIRRIFSITGTDKVIPVFDSLDEAIQGVL